MTLNITVFGVQPEIEICFSQTDGASVSLEKFNFSGASPTKGIHHVKHMFTATQNWNGNVTVYARTSFNTDTSTQSIFVFGGLLYVICEI